MTSRRRVVVIGAGAAGTAAAFAASSAGAEVVIVRGKGGASALSSGALDGAAGGDVQELMSALGAWEMPPNGCRVATLSGAIRAASGRDIAVLDLERVRGRVGVVRAVRSGWDADGLSRAWNGEPWTTLTGTQFVPVDVEWLRMTDEHLLPDVDLAARCDEPERVAWLAERLRHAPSLRDMAAVLVGPWLGTGGETARTLSHAFGKPVGETLSQPGGIAGLRFERARDRLLDRLGISIVDGMVLAIGQDEGVEMEFGSKLAADAIVIATGGLLGGGVSWANGFAVNLRAPVVVGLGGRALDPGSSRFGPSFEPFAWAGGDEPAGFERVGLLTTSSCAVLGDRGAPLDWLYAAGDVVADRPRTIVEALRSGLAAGRAAANAIAG